MAAAEGSTVRRRVLLTTTVGALVAASGIAQASWRPSVSASQTLSSATLDAPGNVRCTSTLGGATPVQLAWNQPTALSGKSTSPLSYTVERNANGGIWSAIATGVTATTYSDNPSGLAALGTTWGYRVKAVYGSWSSPVSSPSVSAVYTLGALLTTCS